jgi:hypothetical protein
MRLNGPRASRRRLLQAGSWALGVAGTSSLWQAAWADAPAGGLAALGRDLDGRLLLPDDAGYAPAAWPNNARWSGVLPQAVAACANDEDVRRCIQWARDQGMPFAIRSGGHSYAGFSTTSGLLIDVKALSGVKVDLDAGTATVQGGANNQDMANALRSLPFAVPSGRCPTVGAGGLTLGGGWGFAATHAGLTCDSLLSTELVLASGRKLVASERDEPDLFWAARGGGGGNFGVHTSFTFKLHPVGRVTAFNIVWPPGRQVELMALLQSIQLANPTSISTRSKVSPTRAGASPTMDELFAQTLGLYFGSEQDLRQILQPALALLKPQIAEIQEMEYWVARDYLVTDDPTGSYDIRSRYVQGALSEAGLETMLRWMSRWPGGAQRQANMGILFAAGGMVKARKPEETAYPHRGADFIFQMEASWAALDGPDTVRRQQDWLSAYMEDMQKFLLPGSYVNFPNRELRDWSRAYYGPNLDRLSAVKRRYDPDGLFRFPQSIPLSPA